MTWLTKKSDRQTVIPPIFSDKSENPHARVTGVQNFTNLKFSVAISIWFEEECSFKPLKEGGFLLHKPSGDFIFNKEEWSDLCRKANVWIWGEDIYCGSEEMKQKLINYGFIIYNS